MVVKKTTPKIQKEKKPKEPQKAPIPEVFLKPKEPSPSNKPSDVLKHYWGFDSFRPFQEEIINSVITGNDVFVVAPTSFGKCFSGDTNIIMYDGSVKNIKDILPDDLLMGPDSKPRKVLNTTTGLDYLYEIKTHKGDVLKVNKEHILSLRHTSKEYNGRIVNISVEDYLKQTDNFKHLHKLYKTDCIHYPQKDYGKLDPYFVGVWLGDGTTTDTSITTADQEVKEYLYEYSKIFHNFYISSHSKFNNEATTYLLTPGKTGPNGNELRNLLKKYNLLGNKHIPFDFKTGSKEQRLSLLAGIIDTDGSYNGSCYDLVFKVEKLAKDIVDVARSLGFSCYCKPCQKTCTNNGKIGTYYRLCIGGDNLHEIPCKIEKKKSKKKTLKHFNTLNLGFTITRTIEKEAYYGFAVDADHLFLTDNYVVVHNSSIYQVPTMCMEGITIVISPLIALQADQVTNSQAIGIPAACLNSELGTKEKRTLLHLLQNKLVKLLYVAPETFFSEGFVPFYETLKQQKINFIAVDESHSASQYSDFRPAYTRIHEARDMFPGIPLLAVTATADRRIKTDILKYCGFTNKYEEFKVPLDRSNLKYNISFDQLSISTQCLEIVKKFSKDTAGIIYFNTRKSAEEITKFLKMCGYDVACYHAGLKKTDKNKAQEDFKNGTVKIMCATTAFGMGVDARVDYVICAQTSQSMEDFVQQCIEPSSLISIEGGYKIASQIKKGDKVLSFNHNTFQQEYKEVDNVFHTNTNKLLHIYTNYGNKLTVTPNHPVYVEDDYVLAENLKNGDILTTVKQNFNISGKTEYLYDLVNKNNYYVRVNKDFILRCRALLTPRQLANFLDYKRQQDWSMSYYKANILQYWINICNFLNIPIAELYANIIHIKTRSGMYMKNVPYYLNEDLAWLLGMIATDGNIKLVKSKQRGETTRIRIFNTNLLILEKVKNICTKYFENLCISDHSSLNSVQPCYEYSFSSAFFTEICNYYGISTSCKTYSVRALNFENTSPSVVASYLAGVIDGDGNYSKKGNLIRILTASVEYSRDLIKLFKLIGVSSRITLVSSEKIKLRPSYDPSKIASAVDTYFVNVSSQSDLDFFISQSKNYSVKTQHTSNASITNVKRPPEKIMTIIEQEVENYNSLNFSVLDNNNYYVNNVLTHNCGRSGRSGKDAHCYLLYNAKDKNTCDFLIRASTKNSERLRIKLNKLHSFHSFCTSNTCIRKGILEYFGEQYNENNCGSCSVCLKKLTK